MAAAGCHACARSISMLSDSTGQRLADLSARSGQGPASAFQHMMATQSHEADAGVLAADARQAIHVLLPVLQAGRYRYRLAAWNAYAWSPYAMVSDCDTDNASLPCDPCERLGTCQTAASAAQAINGSPGAYVESSLPSGWLLGLWTATAGALVAAVVVFALPQPRSHAIQGAKHVSACHA